MAHQEIERKFLVDTSKLDLVGLQGDFYQQGYFSKDANIRVRLDWGKGKYTMTAKGAGTISRLEVEVNIDQDNAAQFYKLCPYKIQKHRYFIPYKGNTWEVDVFVEELAGLYVAEIELNFEHQKFEKPNWLGEEVTYDPEYTNLSLAVNGFPNPLNSAVKPIIEWLKRNNKSTVVVNTMGATLLDLK